MLSSGRLQANALKRTPSSECYQTDAFKQMLSSGQADAFKRMLSSGRLQVNALGLAAGVEKENGVEKLSKQKNGHSF